MKYDYPEAVILEMSRRHLKKAVAQSTASFIIRYL